MPSEPEPRRPHVSKWELATVGSLLLLVAGFHALTLSRQSLFVDEANEIAHAQAPWSEIAAIPDSMPPLFSYLLKAWMGAFGVESVRWLSALAGLVTVAVVWWFARQWVDRQVAAVAAGVLALSPFVLYYAQLVRAYALFTLLAAAAMGLFAVAMRDNRRRDWFALVIVGAMGMWTHYYFAFVLASLGTITLLAARDRWKQLLVSGVGIVILASPIVYSLKSDFAFQRDLREPRSLSAAALAYTYVSFFSGYTLGPSKPELQTLSAGEAAWRMMPWGVGILACSGVLVAFGGGRLARNRLALPVVLLVVAPVALAGLLGVATGITYNVRFVAWCVVPLAVLVAAGVVESWPTWLGRLATAGLLAMSLMAIYHRTLVPRYQNEDLRTAAQYVLDNGSEAEPIYLLSDYLRLPLRFYLPPARQVTELPAAGEVNQSVQTADEAQAAAALLSNRSSGYWLIYSREFHGDPNGLLLEWLQQQHQLAEQATFAGVRVFRGTAGQSE